MISSFLKGVARVLPADSPEFIYTVLLKPRILRGIADAMIVSAMGETKTLPEGTLFLNPKDPAVSGAVNLSVFEPHETRLFRSLVKPGMTVLDVGANIGYYSLIAAKAVGEEGRVIPFEPDPESRGYLQKTIEHNKCSNVQIINQAVSNTLGTATLYVCDYNRGDHRLYEIGETRQKIEVMTTTLDEYCKVNGIRTVDIIKIDVQGFEWRVLGGAAEILAHSPGVQLMFEFWPEGIRKAGGDPDTLLNQLLKAGFSLHEIQKGSGKLLPVRPFELIGRLHGRAFANIYARKKSMKEYDYLACPACRGTLAQSNESYHCQVCVKTYPIVAGVPRLISGATDISRVTAERFGDEWHDWNEVGAYSKDQFLDWLEPLTPEFFAGKRVLDAGCGNGRLLSWAAQFGSSEAVGVDFGKAVEVAHRNTEQFSNAAVFQGDIRHLPFNKESFDFVYCIGVLHHLPDPHEGFQAIWNMVAPGGAISIWVYGLEGNELVRRWVDPFRKAIASRLPQWILHPISYVLSLIAYAMLKLVYMPIARHAPRGYERLPMHGYIRTWFPYPFQEVYNLIYDQLTTPITHYISREQLESWAKETGGTNIRISQRGGNSWRMFVEKK